MKGVKRYDENYNPSYFAATGVYSADNFRENLLELMRMKQLTQAQTAKLCDLSPTQLWNWIEGKSEPSLYSFTRVCEGLEIEPNWLLAKHEPIRKRETK